MNSFDQQTLVCELVTLGSQVEVMVNIFADLLGVSILPQQSSQNSLSSHPENLLGHSGVLSSTSFTMATMSSLSSGFMEGLYSGFRVHVQLSSHYQSILEEFPNVFTYRQGIKENCEYGSLQGQLHWFHWDQSKLSFYRI